MSRHVGAQVATPVREIAEEATEGGEGEGHLQTLVGMQHAEEDALERDGNGDALEPGGPLFLKITTENEFLADAGGEREKQEDEEFGSGARKQVLDGGVPLDVKQNWEKTQH